MSFRMFTNMVSQASRSMAAGILTVGLLLIGFGILILVLPALFAMLAALVFFIAGISCAGTALKIYIAQRRLNKFTRDDSQGYRKNVQIHTEEHYDV